MTNLVDADLLIMLSDIDGFYSANPLKVPDAELIQKIDKIGPTIIAAAGGHGTKYGTGGMTTKLKAAELILKHNQQMVLTNGKNPDVIFNILSGEPVGTLFSKAQE